MHVCVCVGVYMRAYNFCALRHQCSAPTIPTCPFGFPSWYSSFSVYMCVCWYIYIYMRAYNLCASRNVHIRFQRALLDFRLGDRFCLCIYVTVFVYIYICAPTLSVCCDMNVAHLWYRRALLDFHLCMHLSLYTCVCMCVCVYLSVYMCTLVRIHLYEYP